MESMISFFKSRGCLVMVVSALVVVCCAVGFGIYNPPLELLELVGLFDSPTPTLSPTVSDSSSELSPPQLTETQQALETSIAETVLAAQTETQAAKTPDISDCDSKIDGLCPAEHTATQQALETQAAKPPEAGQPAEDVACTIEVKQNLFCRPSPGYAQVDSFTPGTIIEGDNVVGISPDEAFAFVKGKNNRVCTIPIGGTYAELSSGCDLPVLTLMPPPTATPTPTFTPTPEPTNTPSPTLMPSNTPTNSPTP